MIEWSKVTPSHLIFFTCPANVDAVSGSLEWEEFV